MYNCMDKLSNVFIGHSHGFFSSVVHLQFFADIYTNPQYMQQVKKHEKEKDFVWI